MIPRRSLRDLPQGWYPFSARPIMPELEARVLADLGDTWTLRLPERLTAGASADPFALRLWPERLEDPAVWKDPRIVLVAGGADPFDGALDPAYLRQIFKLMVASQEHVFVLLTNRIDKAALFVHLSRTRGLPPILPPNIAIGTPVGTSSPELARVELLRHLPARSRFALESEPAEPQDSLFSA